ncbi:hypothetical protein MKW92_035234, partial [Papaver armeniacum]
VDRGYHGPNSCGGFEDSNVGDFEDVLGGGNIVGNEPNCCDGFADAMGGGNEPYGCCSALVRGILQMLWEVEMNQMDVAICLSPWHFADAMGGGNEPN